MNNLFDIKGKKAIVTGGAQGLGYGMAEGLLESGCSVVIMDVNPKTKDVAEDFKSRGFDAYAVIGDLGDRKEIDRMFEEAMKLLDGRIDILIPAAGIQRRYPSEDFPIEEWDLVMKINLDAVFILCQKAARIMIQQGSGKIINIASMASFFGGVTVPAYTAAKGAIAQMTKAFCNDWAAKGINVNAIAPGYMATELNTGIINNADQTRYKELSARIPMHRWGTPDDMKGVAIFLASPASDYLNGCVIPVDGGYLVR